MKSKKLTRALLILLILALNIGCDQLSKTFVRKKMEIYDEYTYLHRHITIHRVENTGAFLSLGDSLSGPVKTVVLNALPFIAILFGLWYIFTKTNLNRASLVGIILIIGGGIGNIYDRIVHGSVTDFIFINFVLFKTGIFNVADMLITAGTIIILLHALFRKNAEAEDAKVINEKE